MAIFVGQKKNLIVAKTKTILSRIKSIEGKILYIIVTGCLNVRLLRSHKQLDRSPQILWESFKLVDGRF